MDSITLKLFQFLDNQISIEEFEQWVYSTSTLEQFFSRDAYLTLLEMNYSQRYALNKIIEIITSHIDDTKYQIWKLKTLLTPIIKYDADLDDPECILNILECLYYLYAHGFKFLNAFVGPALSTLTFFDQPMSERPWNNIDKSHQKMMLQSFLSEIIADANQVLFWLDQGLIIPLGWGDSDLEYNDYRYPLEK